MIRIFAIPGEGIILDEGGMCALAWVVAGSLVVVMLLFELIVLRPGWWEDFHEWEVGSRRSMGSEVDRGGEDNPASSNEDRVLNDLLRV